MKADLQVQGNGVISMIVQIEMMNHPQLLPIRILQVLQEFFIRRVLPFLYTINPSLKIPPKPILLSTLFTNVTESIILHSFVISTFNAPRLFIMLLAVLVDPFWFRTARVVGGLIVFAIVCFAVGGGRGGLIGAVRILAGRVIFAILRGVVVIAFTVAVVA